MIIKPESWPVEEAQLDLDWQWPWAANPTLALINWRGGSDPYRYGQLRSTAYGEASGVWESTSQGMSYDIGGAQHLNFVANAIDDFTADVPLAMFVAVDQIQDFDSTAGMLLHRSGFSAGYYGLYIDSSRLRFGLHDGSFSNADSGVTAIAGRGYQTFGVVREVGGHYTFVINGVAGSPVTDTRIPGAGTHALNIGHLKPDEDGNSCDGRYLTVWYWYGASVSVGQLQSLHQNPFGPFTFAHGLWLPLLHETVVRR